MHGARQYSTRRLARSAFALGVIAGVAASCSSGSTTDPVLRLGTWGGDTAGMIVGDTAMHLHIGCSFGDVSGRIPVDTHGDFAIAGSYMLRPYPVALGPSMPASFVGRIDGDNATVTVTVNDTVNSQTVILGPVSVRLGRPPEMGACPICRRPIITMPGAVRADGLGR